jgi:hypothetical protein
MLKLNLSVKAFILSAIIVSAIIVGAIAFAPRKAQGTTAYLLITTDKEVYSVGENVTISLYVVNNGSTTIRMPTDSCHYDIYNSSGTIIYGGGAIIDYLYPDRPTILPYDSYLVSSFPQYWNQTALTGKYTPGIGYEFKQAPPGVYGISARLYDYPLNATKTFEIRQ